METEARQNCYRCGMRGHIANDKTCPALSAECRKCSKVGHFAKVCKTKPESRNTGRHDANTVDKSSDDEFSFTLELSDKFISQPDSSNSLIDLNSDGVVTLNVGGVPLDALVDSGSTANVIDAETWRNLKSQNIRCESEPVRKKLYAYGSDKPLSTLGKFQTSVSVGDGVP